jgi:hypothetical protein
MFLITRAAADGQRDFMNMGAEQRIASRKFSCKLSD